MPVAVALATRPVASVRSLPRPRPASEPMTGGPVDSLLIDRFDYWTATAAPRLGATIWCLADDDEKDEADA